MENLLFVNADMCVAFVRCDTEVSGIKFRLTLYAKESPHPYMWDIEKEVGKEFPDTLNGFYNYGKITYLPGFDSGKIPPYAPAFTWDRESACRHFLHATFEEWFEEAEGIIQDNWPQIEETMIERKGLIRLF